jgi:hypothetical protein
VPNPAPSTAATPKARTTLIVWLMTGQSGETATFVDLMRRITVQ